MKFSWNSFPVDQYLLLWPGNNFMLLFSVQIISGKREREREREREKREPRSKRERGGRESRRSTRGAIVWRARRESRRSTSGAIIRRARSLIAPLVDRDCRSRCSSDDRTDLTSPARSHLLLRCAISIWPDLMNFFAGFCFFCEWVWNWFIICMFTVEEVCGKLGM